MSAEVFFWIAVVVGFFLVVRPVATLLTLSVAIPLAVGVLSTIALSKAGFALRLAPEIDGPLREYEQLCNLALAWAEPIIKNQLKNWHNTLTLANQLLPHWKHFFLLMMAFSIVRARNSVLQNDVRSAVAILFFGAACALAASVIAATVPIAASPSYSPQVT